MFDQIINTPCQEIRDPLLEKRGLSLLIKRDDLIHPQVSGNKWRKLKYNFLDAREKSHNRILTFGGAYSNHLYALAAAGKEYGFKTVGLVRGEQHLPLNATLQFATECGMDLHYISRSDYRHKDAVLEKMRSSIGDFYYVPEGGSNTMGVKGVAEMVKEIDGEYQVICLPVGTGGTLAGVLCGLKGDAQVLGFCALKGGDFLSEKVNRFTLEFAGKSFGNYQIITEYPFGGYGKVNKVLAGYINQFKHRTDIPLDPIYTGKMMYGIFDMIDKNKFDRGSTLMVIHTGGLQGIMGINQRYGQIIKV